MDSPELLSLVDEIYEWRTRHPSLAEWNEKVEQLSLISRANGLSEPSVFKILTVITGRHNKVPLNVSLVNALLEVTYPNQLISDRCVLLILNQSQLRSSLKVKTLRWLVNLYEYLEHPRIITQMCGILFSLLPYETTRNWICHLIYISFKSEIVKPWRVRFLLEIYEKNKDSKHIQSLLALCQDNSPQIAAGTFKMYEKVFKQPDPAMAKIVDGLVTRQTVPLVTSKKMGIKRKRLNLPRADPIYQLDSLANFAARLVNLPLPARMGAVLNDDGGAATKLFLYKPDSTSFDRLNTWLANILHHNSSFPIELNFLLNCTLRLSHYLKVCPVGAQDFAINYVTSSSEVNYSVIKILDLLDPVPKMVQSLVSGIKSEQAEHLLPSCESMLRNWSSMSRGEAVLSSVNLIVSFVVERFNFAVSTSDNRNYHSLSTFLQFFKVAAKYGKLPPSSFISFAVYGMDPWFLNEVLAILMLAKESSSSAEVVSAIDGALNTFWRGNALTGVNEFNLDMDLIIELNRKHVKAVFDISVGVQFSALTALYVITFEYRHRLRRHHQGPVTRVSMQNQNVLPVKFEEFRVGLVEYLNKRGFKAVKSIVSQ